MQLAIIGISQRCAPLRRSFHAPLIYIHHHRERDAGTRLQRRYLHTPRRIHNALNPLCLKLPTPNDNQLPIFSTLSRLHDHQTSAMPPKANQTKTKTKKKITRPSVWKPRAPRGLHGMKLKQIQYHRFIHSIPIYHFQASFISISNFKALLNRKEHGYVSTLLSADPLFNTPITDGDEIPDFCLEVGYLRDVFVAGGSALGFRLGNGMLEWMCFNRDIKASILDKLDVDVGMSVYPMLFEHVGDTLRPEGKGRKVRFPEHREWFEGLKGAERENLRLSVTWRAYGADMREFHRGMRERMERGGEEGGEEVEDAGEEYEDEDGGVFDDYEDIGIANGYGPQHHQQYQGKEREAGEAAENHNSFGRDHTYTFNHTAITLTIEKHTPFINRDPDPLDQENATTPSQPPRSKHSRSSSGDSVLSESSRNMVHSQSALTAGQQALKKITGGCHTD
jgi:hypothetical protein